MPKTKVVFYREDDGTVPVLDWLDSLPTKAQDKCRVKIERLKALGHKLRRPEADYLRDDIYELRASLRDINYRMLYFFHGNIAAVVSHGIVKERYPQRKSTRLLNEKRNLNRIPNDIHWRNFKHVKGKEPHN